VADIPHDQGRPIRAGLDGGKSVVRVEIGERRQRAERLKLVPGIQPFGQQAGDRRLALIQPVRHEQIPRNDRTDGEPQVRVAPHAGRGQHARDAPQVRRGAVGRVEEGGAQRAQRRPVAVAITFQVLEDRFQGSQRIAERERRREQIAKLLHFPQVQPGINEQREAPDRRQEPGDHVQHQQRDRDQRQGQEPPQPVGQRPRGRERRQPAQQRGAVPAPELAPGRQPCVELQPVPEGDQRRQLADQRLPPRDRARIGRADSQPIAEPQAALAGDGRIQQAVNPARAGQVQVELQRALGARIGGQRRGQVIPVQPAAGQMRPFDIAPDMVAQRAGLDPPVETRQDAEQDHRDRGGDECRPHADGEQQRGADDRSAGEGEQPRPREADPGEVQPVQARIQARDQPLERRLAGRGAHSTTG